MAKLTANQEIALAIRVLIEEGHGKEARDLYEEYVWDPAISEASTHRRENALYVEGILTHGSKELRVVPLDVVADAHERSKATWGSRRWRSRFLWNRYGY